MANRLSGSSHRPLPAAARCAGTAPRYTPTSFRFGLTGSSARKLKRRGANLLPGRVILEQMDPFTYSEVRDVFDLDRALQLGMLPGIYLRGTEAVATLDTYVVVYLR